MARIKFRRIRRDQVVGDEEANSLFDNDRALDQAIDALVVSSAAAAADLADQAEQLAAHAAAANAHGVTPAAIGAATAAELAAHAAAANPHGVTPAAIGAATAAALQDVDLELVAHLAAATNPHGVTAAQVGAPTLAQLALHTGNASNPHATTAAQVGAAPASHVGAGGGAHAIATSSAAGFMGAGHVQQLEELSALPWAGAFRWDGSKWKSARVRGLEAVADRAGLGLAEVRFLSGLSSADDYAVEITCHGDATKRRQAVVEKLADRVFVQLLAAPDASPTDADGFDIAVRPI